MPAGVRLRKRLVRVKETESSDQQRDQVARDFDSDIETGFQIATLHGPLCAEPMEGMAFFVERVEIDKESIEREKGRVMEVTLRGEEPSLTSLYTRTKKNVANHRVTYFGSQRSLQKWFAGLVATIETGNVFLRHPSFK
jgi:translation elongation factor EF-G